MGSEYDARGGDLGFEFIGTYYRQSIILKNLPKLLSRSYNPPTNLLPTSPHLRCLQLRQIIIHILDNCPNNG